MTLLRERLRVERDLLGPPYPRVERDFHGPAHPFLVLGYRVYPTRDAEHPIRTSTEVIRESPTHYTVEFPRGRER